MKDTMLEPIYTVQIGPFSCSFSGMDDPYEMLKDVTAYFETLAEDDADPAPEPLNLQHAAVA